MTARARWYACGFCGEQVTTRARLEGFAAWESADPECWLRATPAERETLLERGETPGA